MTETTLTLIHILAVQPDSPGSIRTKGTVRTGEARIGDRLWFEGADRKRRQLTVVSIEHTPRWSTIVFSGRRPDLERVVTGTYIRGQSSLESGNRPAVSAGARHLQSGKEGSAHAADKHL